MIEVSIPTVILSIMGIVTLLAVALSYRASYKHKENMRGNKHDRSNYWKDGLG